MIIGGWRGPGWRVVDADPVHGKQVRDWIRSVITRHECPVDPADPALAVSELYANAVMHGPVGGRVLAGYCLWSSGARIVVCDGGGPATPQLRHGIGLAEGGRGLQVIELGRRPVGQLPPVVRQPGRLVRLRPATARSHW